MAKREACEHCGDVMNAEDMGMTSMGRLLCPECYASVTGIWEDSDG